MDRRVMRSRRPRSKRVSRVGLVVVALALAGCNGGTIDRHALTNDGATLDSINCEAWLVSRAASRDRLTVYYTREQAEELALQAANLADALRRRPVDAGLEPRVHARARDASVLASRLWRLHASPADRDGARELSDAFKQAGHCS
jgi:hypothetical protein